MDVLLDWFNQKANYKKEHQAIQDSINAQTRSEEYLGIEFLEKQEEANIIILHYEGKDGINSKSLPIQVSTQAISIILPISSNHP